MLKLLKKLNAKEWLGVVCCIILVGASVYLDLRIPDFTKDITIKVQTGGNTVKDIWSVGLKMIACAALSFCVTLLSGLCTAFIAASFSRRLRKMLFEKVESFGMEEIGKFSTPSLITRSTNDVTQVAMIIAMGMHICIKAPIMAVSAILKISAKNWQWTTATAVAVVVMLTVLGVIMAVATPRFKRVQSLIDNVNRDMRENLTGLKVVRAYNAEAFQENKFEQSNTELTENYLKGIKAMAFLNPTINGVQNFLTLTIYWLGAALINSAGNVATKIGLFGDMVTFSSYSMHVIISFMMLTMIFMMAPRGGAAAARILEVLNTTAKIVDGTKTAGATDQNGVPLVGEVEFDGVSFKYPDAEEYVLENVSFKASKGQTVAFIGSTGSGKSTLINLVPRFYDVTEGSVKVDGVDVREYTQKALHDKMGYVSQKAVLFSGTVRDNIAYGDNGKPKPADDLIKQASQIAMCSEFVEKMPDKYEEHIAQGGSNVSGGQKQRLSIARAIARQPEIYIFDDSFSALDFKTDKILRQNLKNSTSGATCLIVAQRIGTIMDADKIIVLDDGKAVGEGTHEQLLKTCEVYRQIALSQLSEEELKDVG